MNLAEHWCPELLAVLALVYFIWRPDSATRVWQDFLDSLNTDGGHIVLLAVFVMVCVEVGSLSSHIELFSGALLGYLKGAGSNKSRRDQPIPGPSRTTIASVQTETPVTDPNEKEKS